MSEIRDKATEQIENIYESFHGAKPSRHFADQILSIHEIAVVDRDAELPSAYEDFPTAQKPKYAPRLRWEIEQDTWVKEVKDG